MAGDTLRDAFRSRLATHVATAPATTRPVKDLVNTAENPDASSPGFIYLEFPGGSEEQYTFGAPASNLFRERGQVTLRIASPLGAGTPVRDSAEADAELLRARFRNDRFAAGSRSIRVTSVQPMGGGLDDGGLWIESIGIAYELYNVA